MVETLLGKPICHEILSMFLIGQWFSWHEWRWCSGTPNSDHSAWSFCVGFLFQHWSSPYPGLLNSMVDAQKFCCINPGIPQDKRIQQNTCGPSFAFSILPAPHQVELNPSMAWHGFIQLNKISAESLVLNLVKGVSFH